MPRLDPFHFRDTGCGSGAGCPHCPAESRYTETVKQHPSTTTGSISWHDGLSVGVAAMDAQHRQWLSILNDLYVQADARKSELFAALLERDVEAPWFDAVAQLLYDERRLLGDEGVDAAFERILAASPHARVRAHALQQWSRAMDRSRDDARKARGEALEERLLDEFSDEVLAEVLSGKSFRARFLQVGQIAPDFASETVDGVPVRLSDFRGKVVLIDFWGFW